MTQIDIKNLLAMFDQTHMRVFFYILIYTIFQFLDAVQSLQDFDDSSNFQNDYICYVTILEKFICCLQS